MASDQARSLLTKDQHTRFWQWRRPPGALSREGCRYHRGEAVLLRPNRRDPWLRGGAGCVGTGRSPWRPAGSSVRFPTMWTSAARNALAVRTTVPMFMSCCQFSMATWNGCRRLSRSATMASTSNTGIGPPRCGGHLSQKFWSQMISIWPWLWMGPNAHFVSRHRHQHNASGRIRLTPTTVALPNTTTWRYGRSWEYSIS